MMAAGHAAALFEDDRPWLETQPGMQSWFDGCAMLDKCLGLWVRECGESICGRVPQPGEAQHARCQRRLWKCWAYHWRQASEVALDGRIAGAEVARSIRAGRGYVGQGKLGGDPLEDVILAEAVQRREAAAIQLFERRHKAFAVAQGVKANYHIAEEPDDWWCRLLDELGGYSRPPGKLERFHGRCGLRNWLGAVARNFARQELKRMRSSHGCDNEVDGIVIPNGQVETRECLELLAAVVAAAMDQLSREDRALLYLLHVDQIPANEVARRFQLHPGNIARRRRKAAASVRAAMLAGAAQFVGKDAYQDCVELLTQQRDCQRFADVFYETLQRLGEEALGDIPGKESGP